MPDPAEARNRALIKSIEDLGREVRNLRRAVEDAAKDLKPQETNQILNVNEVATGPIIHLAFMNPNDPRPSCWEHTGLGGKFTITSYEEYVTCKKCLDAMAQNQ